jgi:HK97 family phage prohead protease
MAALGGPCHPRHGPLVFVKNRLPLVKREQLIAEAMKAEGHRAVSSERREFLKGTYLTVEKEEGLPDRTIRIIISTGARDRQRDTIDQGGWNLSNYLKNPVVLYGHNYWGFPIARDMGITVEANRLIGTPRFTTREENPEGDMTYQLILGGYLNAASVGFAPEEWFYNEPERGLDFKKQELLEYSIVPIPANPEALVEARSAGIDLAPMKSWAEQVLELDSGPGLWLPKERVEQVMKVLTPRKFVVPMDIPEEFVRDLAKEMPAVVFERATAAPPPTTDPAKPLPPEQLPPGTPAGAAGARAVTPPVSDGKGSPDITLAQVQLKLAAQWKQAFEVQTLIFPKAHWDSAQECKDWAKEHDFKTGDVDETEESWRLRQRDPDDFSRMRTICINPSDAEPGSDDCKVKAVGGPLKEAAEIDGQKEPEEDELAEVLDQPAAPDKGLKFTMDIAPVDPLFDLIEEPALQEVSAGLLPDGITPEMVKEAILGGVEEAMGRHLTRQTGRLD